MANKTSQLQIRITTEQKRELKRLAAARGVTVSEYVLATVLPRQRYDVADRTEALVTAYDRPGALSDLGGYLTGLDAGELMAAVELIDLDGMPSVLQNYVAAMVELATGAIGAEPPDWVTRVEPLARPHFARDLPSLRPHQMRVTPVTFKRRNVFVDVEAIPVLRDRTRVVRPGPAFGSSAEPLLALNDELRRAGLLLELCPSSTGFLAITYAAAPDTRSIRALFGPASRTRSALEVATAAPAATAATAAGGTGGGGLGEALNALERGPAGVGTFVELTNLRVYAGSPEYLLAVKCAALRWGSDDQAEAEIGGLLAELGVATVDEALIRVGHYFTTRQQPPDLAAILERLLPSRPGEGITL